MALPTVTPGQWYRHKNGNLYQVLSVSGKIKLWRWWFNIPLVHYTSADPLDTRVYCRFLSQFATSFTLLSY